jgi:charged multivesicular body protein 5
VDARASGVEEKIKKLDQELMGYKNQMSKLKPGSGPHNAIKQRALKVMKQKKMYFA